MTAVARREGTVVALPLHKAAGRGQPCQGPPWWTIRTHRWLPDRRAMLVLWVQEVI